jgi:hypothetical protein
MGNTLFVNTDHIGLKKRTSTPGPEIDMVNDFIDTTTKTFKHKKNKLAIFIEPMVDKAYPDIVFAEYNPTVLDNWCDARNNIEIIDMKILENLRALRGSNSDILFKRTHFSYKTILQSIERLYDAGFVARKNKAWKAKPLRELYSIKRLVSVEAKIGDMENLLRQADANRWFASESFALSQAKKPQKTIIQRFQDRGVGLCSLNDGKIIEFSKPTKQKLPTNYMSWMFNEWVGRYATST